MEIVSDTAKAKDERVTLMLISFERLTDKWGLPPTITELAEQMGLSYATTHNLLEECLSMGLVNKRPNVSRGVQLTSAGERRLRNGSN